MTKIEWTEITKQVTAGCSKCAAGCAHCYAEDWAYRLACMARADIAKGKDPGLKRYYLDVVNMDTGKWNGNVVCIPEALDEILRMRKPRKIFLNSMSDLFHEKVPYDLYWPPKHLTKTFATMLLCQQHTFLVLTKRISRALKIFTEAWPDNRQIPAFKQRISNYLWEKNHCHTVPTKEGLNEAQLKTLIKFDKGELWPLPNVHLGVSISTQEDADKNIPILLQIPAAVRFVSIEPMLEGIDLWKWDGFGGKPKLDSIILGCESINGRVGRLGEFEEERLWLNAAAYTVNQCRVANIPVFVKQLSINGKVSHNPKEWPKDLRVRDYPK